MKLFLVCGTINLGLATAFASAAILDPTIHVGLTFTVLALVGAVTIFQGLHHA